MRVGLRVSGSPAQRGRELQDVPFSSIETIYLWVSPLPATVPIEPLR
jgi:hypothetical protein